MQVETFNPIVAIHKLTREMQKITETSDSYKVDDEDSLTPKYKKNQK